MEAGKIAGLVISGVAVPGGTGKNLVTAAKTAVENPGRQVSWLAEYSYIFIPLIALYVVSRIYRLKQDS
jgi:hypothetical protein